MTDLLKNIIDDSGECLSEEQLKGYVQGLLTPLEVQQAELHLADCELCSDAVDGLKSSGSAAQLHTDVSRINRRIEKKYKHKRLVIFYSPWKIIGVAASVVAIILGIGVYFNLFVNTRLQVVADRLENLKDQITSIGNKSTSSKDTLTIITQKNRTETDANVPADAYDTSPLADMSTNSAANDSLPVTDNALADNSKLEDLSSTIGNASNPTVTDKALAQEEVKPTAFAPATTDAKKEVKIPTTKDVSEKEFETEKAKQTVDVCTPALNSYKARNYILTQQQLLAVLAKEPGNLKAKYYLGLAYFMQEKYIDAIKQFDQIMLQSNEQYYEEARFQKALAHIKIDDALTAKAIFQQIIAEESPYKAKAESYLKELK